MDAASQAWPRRHYDAERLVAAGRDRSSRPSAGAQRDRQAQAAGRRLGGRAGRARTGAEGPSVGRRRSGSTYATALRDLGRTDEELAALNKALLLEPTNMRALLQSAALHERRGDPRTAAATYRKVLSADPAGRADPARHALAARQGHGARSRPTTRALEAFLADHLEAAARAPRRPVAAPVRQVAGDPPAEAPRLSPAADLPLPARAAGHRVLRARRLPLAGQHRGGDRRHPRGADRRAGRRATSSWSPISPGRRPRTRAGGR